MIYTSSQYNLHEVGMTISVAQLRAARGLVGWSQQELADKSEVGRATIADFEAGKRVPYATTLLRLQETLTAAGVLFIPENGGGVGVRLRKVDARPSSAPSEGEAGIIESSDM
jgi:transcriptional regulator with XRE-family HTH domain